MNTFSKLIIVQHQYASTTPKTQRMLAAAREYVKLGVNVVFVVSTEDSKFDDIDGVRFIRIEEHKNNILNCYKNFVIAIKREYNEHSAILFYEIPLYAGLFSKVNYRVFAEVTEIPFYGNNLSFVKKIILRIRLRAARNFSGLFVISKALKEYYSAQRVKNIEVVNMFVDASRFDLPKTNTSEKYIAYCGRISYQKDGVNDLIQAFKYVHDVHPEYRLKLIGAFENEQVKKGLQALVIELNLNKYIDFPGLIPPEELPMYLKNAEILALARPNNIQARYGFPTKLGEYLATGNPVVVTSVGEIPLYIKNRENGYLAEPCNPRAFAENIIYAIDNPDVSTQLGKRGRELTLNEFSSLVQINKALKFINMKM